MIHKFDQGDSDLNESVYDIHNIWQNSALKTLDSKPKPKVKRNKTKFN